MQDYLQAPEGRITILAGAEISPAIAREIVEASRTTEIHFSAIQRIQLPVTPSAVSMGKDFGWKIAA